MKLDLTQNEFLSAASKGNGRAITTLREGLFRPSFRIMRRLVLRWPGYDWQLEPSRGWYSVELMKACEYEEELTGLVIRHLARNKGQARHRSHRTAIVFELARRGNLAAKQALYDGFDPSDDFRFGDEIIELDGFEGLEWLYDRSKDFLAEDKVYQLGVWRQILEGKLGEEAVLDWMMRESLASPEIAELERLSSPHTTPYKCPAEPRLSFEAVREERRTARSKRMRFLRWSLSADKAELEKAWQAFELENDAELLNDLSRALSRHPERCNIEKLIDRARSWDDDTNPFIEVLEKVVEPRIRNFGIELLKVGRTLEGVALLAKNAAPGDEPTILQAVSLLSDEDDLHVVGFDLTDLDKGLDTKELLIWMVENTPCSYCRGTAVRRLLEKGEALDKILRECLLDCDEDTRTVATRALAIL